MATEQDALRRQIIEKREEVGDDLVRLRAELERSYRSATDWRGMIRQRPFAAIGAGLGVGLFAGLIVGGFVR